MRWRRAPRAALAVGVLGLAGLALSASLRRVSAHPPRGDPASVPIQSLGCARVGSDAWSPLPGVEYTGTLLIDLPASDRATLSLIIGDSIPLDLEAASPTGHYPYRRERLRYGPGVGVPPDLWLEGGDPWDLPRELTRITLEAQPDRAESIELSLGRRAPRVLARLDGYDATVRTRVCAATHLVDRSLADAPFSVVPAESKFFATGWYAEESRDDGADRRWMREHGAILIPSSRDGDVVVTLRAAPPVTPQGREEPLLSLRVNDLYDALTVPMSPGVRDYEWTIPSTAWVAGINEVLFSVSRTPLPDDTGGRTVGLALERLTVTLNAAATER
jgi:hypothetical protein